MTDWPVKTLDALCDEGIVLLGRGNIISRKDIAVYPGPYPIYSSARENEGKFGEYGAYMFDEEMITWSIDGGGRLFYRPKHRFSVTNVGGTLRVLKPEVLEIRYLHKALENLHSRKVFDWVFKAHPSVIRKVYDEIPVPPLEEQKRIVGLLDAATERVTELTACYEQARTHANNLFASALRDSLASNPDWPVKTLGEVVRFESETAKPEDLSSRDVYVGLENIASNGTLSGLGNVSAETLKSNKSRFTDKHILFGKLRPYLVKVVRPDFSGVCSTDILPISPLAELSRDFLYWFMRSPAVIEAATEASTGTTLPRVSSTTLKSFEIPVPPLEEQKKIVAQLDLMRAKTSEMVAAYDAKLTAAKNLRQSILEAAFAGDL